MADFDLKEARRQLMKVRNLVQIGAQWEHRKSGSRYWVQGAGLRESDGEPLVIYRDAEIGTCWIRPASEFLDGRFRQLKAKV